VAQFDVHRFGKNKRSVQLVIDVQNDMLAGLATCVVVPLHPIKRGTRPIRVLNPEVVIDGSKYYLSTAELAGIHRTELGERVASLVDRRSDIIGAIDLLFTGI
jgi:toxin CcdB